MAFTEKHVTGPSPLIDPNRDRAVLKWRRPPEFTLGLTLALDIHVPEPDVLTPRGDLEDDLEIVWVPCPIDWQVSFALILGASVEWDGWPGRRSTHTPTRLVYQERLGNGETLWVVSKAERLSPERRRTLAEQRATGARAAVEQGIDLDLTDPTLRFLGMGVENGIGFINDLTLTANLMEPGAFELQRRP